MRNYEKENVGVKSIDKDGDICYTAGAYARYGSYGHIYKNYAAFYEPEKYPEDEIVFISEFGFPDSSNRENVKRDNVLGVTRKYLIDLTGGEKIASNLFERLSWQFASTLWDEDWEDSDENGHWIEGYWAYEKVYLPEFADGIDRINQEPVCLNEFLDVEWQDKEYRQYCLDKLAEQGIVRQDTIKKIMKDFQTEGEMC